jgi:hypothetical protein
MRPSNAVSRLLVIAGAAAMAGCYSYVPVERPAPGSVVRIQVPMRQAVIRPNQRPELVSLEGTVLSGAGSSGADSLVLEISSTGQQGPFRELTQVDTVRLASDDLAAVDLRLFSKPRTLGLTGVIVGGVVALALSALNQEGGSTGSELPGNGTSTSTSIVVTPIFRHALGH